MDKREKVVVCDIEKVLARKEWDVLSSVLTAWETGNYVYVEDVTVRWSVNKSLLLLTAMLYGNHVLLVGASGLRYSYCESLIVVESLFCG